MSDPTRLHESGTVDAMHTYPAQVCHVCVLESPPGLEPPQLTGFHPRPCRLPVLGQAHAGTRGQSGRPPPPATPRCVDHDEKCGCAGQVRCRRAVVRIPVPHPRSGWTVRSTIRHYSRRCRHPGGQDSSSLPPGELLRRTIRPHRQSRAHRPNIDLQSAAPAGRARRVRSPLQRSTTPPCLRTSPSATGPSRGRPQL